MAEHAEVLKDDSSALSFTQRERLRLFNITSEHIADPKMLKIALSTLKDMDSQILTKQRLEADKEGSAADREVALQVARVSEEIARSMKNPFRAVPGTVKVQDPVKDPSVAGKHSFKEGEFNADPQKQTHDEFMSRFERDAGIEPKD